MICKKNFNELFEIVGMNNKSLTLEDRHTGERCFMHRNIFNKIMKSYEDFKYEIRMVDSPSCSPQKWVAIQTWQMF